MYSPTFLLAQIVRSDAIAHGNDAAEEQACLIFKAIDPKRTDKPMLTMEGQFEVRFSSIVDQKPIAELIQGYEVGQRYKLTPL